MVVRGCVRLARVRASARVCVRLCAYAYFCAEGPAGECVRLRAWAYVCVCLREYERARVVGVMHTCAHPCLCRCVSTFTYACFLGCATMPGYRRLGKNIKPAIST